MKPACGRRIWSPALRYSGRWLDGGRGALAAALKREKARDEMRGGMVQAYQPGYI
jgi:hypothetical protein